ncbi:MAG TPA: carboxypeptidase-like regulatory domain-containing protein [Ginsengibacter sp.]|nr:carboxypeptidase-like regulatory domain-containing protein [Ginsengibacter sp.]HRP45305.1 carboxypeptidase-like regulatory domain-containing protein [Ginsengibacter sp.]
MPFFGSIPFRKDFITAFLCGLLLIIGMEAVAQKGTAVLSGKVIDENEDPIARVSINILGKQGGWITSDSGTFRLEVPAGKAFALVFTHEGFREVQRNFLLNPGESELQIVRMYRTAKGLEEVVIRDDRFRNEPGLVKVNPKNAIVLPSATGGVEGLIKILVGSNNELTSQYAVRGGNYDENLIYINDFEIFRPYLVRAGQQEGLSFINPELVRNINFYNGGFQAKYGDKISSVLDISYKQPAKFVGSAYISLLEQGLHLEGASRNKKASWLIGARTKTNRNLLSSQETKGNYIPSSSDIQAFLSWKLTEKWQLEALGILSVSDFQLIPESAQKTTTVITPLFSANLGLDVYFEGREKDRYRSYLTGLSLNHSVNSKLKLKWLFSRYDDEENENFDILGAYLFGERSFDKTKPTFGQIVNPLGAGLFQNFARNQLHIQVYNLSHKGFLQAGKHYVQWGAGWEHQIIKDHLNEWEMHDSAGYSLPYNPAQLVLKKVLKSDADLQSDRIHGYLQDNILLGHASGDISMQAGVRFNYNSLNGEFLVSPRIQLNYKPEWKRDFVIKASGGVYDQPPFYRELRRPDGTINKSLKSQKSIQFTAGFDYNTTYGNKPLRITTEAYYKSLTDVVSYDLDNVRIIYSGENNARAYAMGVETRLFTELVKDAESWLSVNISRTMENLKDDHYYLYTNAAGEVINSQTEDQVVADSIRQEMGWIRRPSDRLVTVGLFLQDYLSTNKNFRVHLNLIYGSNMTYNIPNSVRYRNGLILEPYFRVDAGFSALLLSEKSLRRSHSPFRSFENIWASLEVFNMIDRRNVISYQLIKDFSNNVFSIPNRLTPRLINFKLLARF